MGVRTLKFRLWNEEQNKIQQLEQLNCYNLQDDFSHPNGVILQYTGLNDKNGTPIYEGDIVEYKDYSGGAYLFSKQPLDRDVVKWNKSTGGYKVRGMGYTFNADKYEVIGNIHENPELLRGNKE